MADPGVAAMLCTSGMSLEMYTKCMTTSKGRRIIHEQFVRHAYLLSHLNIGVASALVAVACRVPTDTLMLWLLDLPDEVDGRPVAAAAATGNTTINGVHVTQNIQSNNAGVASMQASRAAESKAHHHRHLISALPTLDPQSCAMCAKAVCHCHALATDALYTAVTSYNKNNNKVNPTLCW
jgi:hypothetical protein